MKHKTNRDTETEHIIAGEGTLAGAWTHCGQTVYGTAEVKSPEIAEKVADNLCGTCRKAMPDDEEMSLYEMADEASNASPTL